MKPLSSIKHYLSNSRKFLFMFIPVLLSIIVIYVIRMVISSEFYLVERTYVEPQKYYSSIAAKTKVINPSIIESIFSRQAEYEKIFPWVAHYTYLDGIIEKSIGSKVFTVKSEDMIRLIGRMKLKLVKGRLPAAGTNEIVLHKTVARNKNLAIGDRIGSSVSQNETIEGEKIIVGLLDGESIVSFDSLEYWMEQNHVEFDDYSTGIILIPNKNSESTMEQILQETDAEGLDVRTYDIISRKNKNDSSNITIIMTVINIMILIMITVCSGFISYININQRRNEFGILSAIGYTTQYIINRLIKEILLVSLAALVIGILCSISFGAILNMVIFNAKGIPLILIEPDFIIQAACIPLFVCIFALVPVWSMLKNLDPAAIIEGMV